MLHAVTYRDSVGRCLPLLATRYLQLFAITHRCMQVVERAESKLQMDAAVIQQGRLAEKQKALSKEEALEV